MSLLSILREKHQKQEVQLRKLATIATVNHVTPPTVAIVAKDAGLKTNNLTSTLKNEIGCTWQKHYFEVASRNRWQLEEKLILAEFDFVKSRNKLFEHHWLCVTCIAAGKGYGHRCAIGENLNSAYEANFKEKCELEKNISKLLLQSKVLSSLPYRIVLGKSPAPVITQPISHWSDHD